VLICEEFGDPRKKEEKQRGQGRDLSKCLGAKWEEGMFRVSL